MIDSFTQTVTDRAQMTYNAASGDVLCDPTDDTYYSELTEVNPMPNDNRRRGQANGSNTSQTLYPMADDVILGQDDTTNVCHDVISTATDRDYDKLFHTKAGNDVEAANVYGHANPNTDSTYDRLKRYPSPMTI